MSMYEVVSRKYHKRKIKAYRAKTYAELIVYASQSIKDFFVCAVIGLLNNLSDPRRNRDLGS